MTNPPPLLAEDRPEYERLLAEALRDRTILTALRAPGALTADQLRIRALRDADAIAAAATTEYLHYTRLRESLRATPPPPEGTEPIAPGLLTQLRSANGGAGLFPVLTVLTPILAWTAALVLLLLGYLLRAANPDLTLARSLVTAGWAALAAGVAAMAVGIIGLVLTAIRDGAAAPAGTDPELAAELADAHREWRAALRDRGLLPYLHANLPAVPGAGRAGPDFSSPDFSSPDFSGPGYSSPSFTSPGPDGPTGPEGHEPRPAAFTTPDFTGPGYSSPSFTSPDDVT
ncbi:hypothetical protein P3T27_000425 [Kitasatospora sp. MAA19]|uniref:hypothetical protein n=1 Tax=Kitasatospora sp. MAA19 TaxID=3035090 RepID=UPI0024757FEE|nr:hypothetical protein [Kitasatospora sp. MAA19]MDH6703744.1 hypothetical protein [Kitasatospora sp. MAA19]